MSVEAVRVRAQSQDPLQFRGVDVAAGHDADHALPCEAVAQLVGRRDRRPSPAPSAKIVRGLQRHPHALGQLLFRQLHEVVEVLLVDAERQIEADARGDAFRKGLRGFADHASGPFQDR